MTPQNRFFGEGRFQRKPGEPRFVEEFDMEKRLMELEGELIAKMSIYMRLEPSKLDELKVEEREWVVQQDGEHLYIGKKTVEGAKDLSVVDTAVYAARQQVLEQMAQRYVFCEEEYLEEDPDRKVYPCATDILIGCIEQMRQLFENHRFTAEQFKIVYRPLAKLARQMTLFQPGFTKEERDLMIKEDGMKEEEIDAMVQGAQQIHQYFCETFGWYECLAEAVIDDNQ
jgi:hypothetical protein